MNDKIKEQVIRMLANTHIRIRNIELLRFELQNCAKVTSEDMIDVLTFGHGNCERCSPSTFSDKTLRIALNYERKTEEANKEILHEVCENLLRLENEQNRLEKYISLLDVKSQEIIRMSYFECMTWSEISEKTGIPTRTAQMIRRRAEKELCEMYELTEPVR